MSETKTIYDGGPAFPAGESYVSTDLAGNKTSHSKAPLYPGMSLRVWLAGRVLPTLILEGGIATALEDEDMKLSPDGHWIRSEVSATYTHVKRIGEGIERFEIATSYEDRCARAALRYADALLARIRRDV